MRKLILTSIFLTACACAAENGASIYPAGVETVIPGLLPPPGKTLVLQCNTYYEADNLLDSQGHSRLPGFHLSVAAFAARVVHNWGFKVLGGDVVSSFSAPFLDTHVRRPTGDFQKSGLGNANIGVAALAYHKAAFHWWYGVNVFLPAPNYNKDEPLHIGQHFFATAPAFALTALPHRAKSQLSLKAQYIVPRENTSTNYVSGRELVIEYAALQNVTRKLAAGANGYFDRQLSDDVRNGIAIGNRARSFAFGPQIRYHFDAFDVILKYQREMLVQNKAAGNVVWLQFGVPLWGRER